MSERREDELRPGASEAGGSEDPAVRDRWNPLPGIILIAVGGFFLASNLGLLAWFDWETYWPLVPIIVGVVLLVRRGRE